MKNKIASVLLLLTMSVSLVACGSKDKSEPAQAKKADISASEVIAKMSEASEVKGVDAKANINFDASLSNSYGDKMSVAVKADMDVKSTQDPVAAYVNADMSIKADKDTEDLQYEVYCVMEDDQYKVYFGNEESGWAKSEMSLDELGIDINDMTTGSMGDLKEYFSEENINEYFDDVKVTEKKVNDKDCYSVQGNVSSDLLSTAISSLEAMAGTSLSIPDISLSLEICVDKKTNLPAAFYLKGGVAENDTIDINACEISIEYNGYDVDEITVPEEALNGTDMSQTLEDAISGGGI